MDFYLTGFNRTTLEKRQQETVEEMNREGGGVDAERMRKRKRGRVE